MNAVFEPPFRSRKVLAHAKGKPCTFRFPGVCDGGGATTVPCHIRDRHKGGAIKASDHSIGFGCLGCHDFLDVGYAKAGWTLDDLLFYEKRALQETWEILIQDEILGFPHNRPKAPRKTTKKSERADRPKSKWATGRKLQSRNNLKRGRPR